MMKSFTYHLPTKIVFGPGALKQLKTQAAGFGAKRVLLVTGSGAMRKTGTLERVLAQLEGFDVTLFEKVESDPSTDTVDAGARMAAGCGLIIALGGGSPLDAAKAISVVAGNGGAAGDYISGKAAARAGPPIIAIPTTSGTGSEVTEVSVLTDRAARRKKSFRSVHMYPSVALDDPELTVTMPREVTASAGLDALTHAVEALTSAKSQPITDALCMEAGKLILDNIVKAYEDGKDIEARQAMMLGSLMAGYGITHAAAGLAHGLSYALWKVADTPHGLACGTLLPHVMRFNLGYEGGKYLALARYCGYKSPEDLISRVEEANKALNVPARLAGLQARESDIGAMVESGMGGSTAVNPRPVDAKTMETFIKKIM
jgi:alcohol dehydrogenase class IV